MFVRYGSQTILIFQNLHRTNAARSVNSVQDEEGGKQLPESWIWLFCCSDLVDGPRQVNASPSASVIPDNTGKTLKHLLFLEVFASQGQ